MLLRGSCAAPRLLPAGIATMKNRFWIAAGLATALFSASASAQEYRLGGLRIVEPWTRVSPGKTGSAYLSVTNTGGEADRLIGASSPMAEKAELHTHQRDGDVMRMRPVQAIEVPPDESAVLKPGGLHIMLLGLKEPIRTGKSVPLTLRFEKAGAVEVELVVEAAGAAGPGHAGHGGAH